MIMALLHWFFYVFCNDVGEDRVRIDRNCMRVLGTKKNPVVSDRMTNEKIHLRVSVLHRMIRVRTDLSTFTFLVISVKFQFHLSSFILNANAMVVVCLPTLCSSVYCIVYIHSMHIHNISPFLLQLTCYTIQSIYWSSSSMYSYYRLLSEDEYIEAHTCVYF